MLYFVFFSPGGGASGTCAVASGVPFNKHQRALGVRYLFPK
jgi:hypothetical protein